MISEAPFKGAKFVIQKPNRKAPDGVQIFGYAVTEQEANASLRLLVQNKGRRTMAGTTVVPINRED